MQIYEQYLLEKLLDIKYIMYFICALYIFSIAIAGVLLDGDRRLMIIRALLNIKTVFIFIVFLVVAFCIPVSISYIL